MATKLDAKTVANSLALVTAIFYLVCILLLWVSPSTGITYFNYLAHGVDMSTIMKTNLSFALGIGSIIVGAITAWIAGYLFAVIHNKLAK